MDYQQLAAAVLGGRPVTREEACAVLATPDDEVLLLLAAAGRIRAHHFGRAVRFNVLTNAKSGLCPEDCHYCSQSSVSDAEIDVYPLLPRAEVVERARWAQEAGAMRYCLVCSGRGPSDHDVVMLAEMASEIRRQTDLTVCCSLGLLTEPQAITLKEAGVSRINHNLNTSRRFYPEICSTHTYDDRMETLRVVRRAGLETCCGVIVGQGETAEDLVDVAFALRDLDVDSAPVNFLHPVPGTPLEDVSVLTPLACLRALALFRFVLPNKEIRAAGGREFNLRGLQALALYAADSIFVGGYLTTPGQPPEEAARLVADMGLYVDRLASA